MNDTITRNAIQEAQKQQGHIQTLYVCIDEMVEIQGHVGRGWEEGGG